MNDKEQKQINYKKSVTEFFARIAKPSTGTSGETGALEGVTNYYCRFEMLEFHPYDKMTPLWFTFF